MSCETGRQRKTPTSTSSPANSSRRSRLFSERVKRRQVHVFRLLERRESRTMAKCWVNSQSASVNFYYHLHSGYRLHSSDLAILDISGASLTVADCATCDPELRISYPDYPKITEHVPFNVLLRDGDTYSKNECVMMMIMKVCLVGPI